MYFHATHDTVHTYVHTLVCDTGHTYLAAPVSRGLWPSCACPVRLGLLPIRPKLDPKPSFTELLGDETADHQEAALVVDVAALGNTPVGVDDTPPPLPNRPGWMSDAAEGGTQ